MMATGDLGLHRPADKQSGQQTLRSFSKTSPRTCACGLTTGMVWTSRGEIPTQINSRINANNMQIRKAPTLRYDPSWQGPTVMAGIGMLSIRGNAHLRQGEKRGPAAVCGRKLQTKNDQMHAQRINLDQEAPETCGVQPRYFLRGALSCPSLTTIPKMNPS